MTLTTPYMKGLRAKLIAPFLLGSLTLTLLLSWYTYSSARKSVEEAVILIAEAQASRVTSSMSLLFRSLLTTVQNMVVDPHVTNLFTDADQESARRTTTEWLEIYTQSNDYYRDILVVNRLGVCIASSNPGQIGAEFADEPHVQRALGGMVNFGESSVGQVTKKLSTVIAAPIDTGGEVAGALVLICDLPQIVDYSTISSQGAQAVFTAILDSDGQLLVHRDREVMNGETRFPELYAQLVTVGKQGGKVNFSLGGKTYVGFAIIEPSSKWVIFSSGITEEVFASAYAVGFTVFTISLLVLCVISFIVIRFANGILGVLLSLINYAKHVSEGKFDLELANTSRSDELGVLHTSLQRLVLSLRSMLEQSQEASKMKGEFLANMSHEIRTPLNAVIGLAHLSLRDTTISPKQKSNLEQIQLAAKSLLGIINDILDISKIESGKLVLDNTPFNLREHVKHVMSIHLLAASSKSLALNQVYEQGMPDHFFGDPLRIGQILNNLLSNAIKFTMQGNVTVRIHSMGPQDENGFMIVQVSVTDSGIGIDEASCKNLFQPFTQADASITRKFGGTGLGLAISERLVHMMGGSFIVDSQLGKGSTFSFSMRLMVDNNATVSIDKDRPKTDLFEQLPLAGKRILIVEDNMLNQMILEELISPTTATVVTADNGQQAVDAVREQPFDIVFMDMQMPIMDGLQATEIIRQEFSSEELPIIAVTANAMKEDQEKGIASGMNDYITKPIEPEHLAEILRKWLVK